MVTLPLESVVCGTNASANVSGVSPRLVTVNEAVDVTGAVRTEAPNDKVVGSKAAVARIAAATSRRPFPAASKGAGCAPWRTTSAAALTNADLVCAGGYVGRNCRTNAAAPAVNGDEKLVPSATRYCDGSYISPSKSFT